MSIFTALFDLNTCLVEHGVEPEDIAIVLPRKGFENFRASVSAENPSENWNKGYAFNYAGLWFLDGEAFQYAKKGVH